MPGDDITPFPVDPHTEPDNIVPFNECADDTVKDVGNPIDDGTKLTLPL
jgi:hypothetical protein